MENSQSHRLHVSYTIEDDGIHVTCGEKNCRFEEAVGFWPSISDIVKVEKKHQEKEKNG